MKFSFLLIISFCFLSTLLLYRKLNVVVAKENLPETDLDHSNVVNINEHRKLTQLKKMIIKRLEIDELPSTDRESAFRQHCMIQQWKVDVRELVENKDSK